MSAIRYSSGCGSGPPAMSVNEDSSSAADDPSSEARRMLAGLNRQRLALPLLSRSAQASNRVLTCAVGDPDTRTVRSEPKVAVVAIAGKVAAAAAPRSGPSADESAKAIGLQPVPPRTPSC